MADRNQYDQAYGKDSPYYATMLELAKRNRKNQAHADAPVTAIAKLWQTKLWKAL